MNDIAGGGHGVDLAVVTSDISTTTTIGLSGSASGRRTSRSASRS